MSITTAELCARYRRLYVPAVCDALYELGLPEPVLPSALRPLHPTDRIAGIAYTLVGRPIDPPVGWEAGIERISSYLDLFPQLPPDSVLVSVNPGSEVGHFGELTGTSAQRHGCVGVILDGNLRDIAGLREIGLQVFYRDLSPLNAIGRWEMAAAQVPVTIGGITIYPGDVIVAEFDGVVVVPAAEAERVLETAEAIVSSETQVRGEMAAGESPLASLQRHGHI